MEGGVTILDPASTYIEDTVTIGPDTTVYPQVVIEGQSTIGGECVIGVGCHVSASRIAERVTLLPYCVVRGIGDRRGRDPRPVLPPAAALARRARRRRSATSSS